MTVSSSFSGLTRDSKRVHQVGVTRGGHNSEQSIASPARSIPDAASDDESLDGHHRADPFAETADSDRRAGSDKSIPHGDVTKSIARMEVSSAAGKKKLSGRPTRSAGVRRPGPGRGVSDSKTRQLAALYGTRVPSGKGSGMAVAALPLELLSQGHVQARGGVPAMAGGTASGVRAPR